MHADVLLAGGEWRPRALVLAQLEEAGVQVTAVETWDEAELLLRKHAVQPAAVIFDVEGETHPEAALVTLHKLVGPVRSLILTSGSVFPAAAVRGLGFDHVLARPYSVADVVAAARALIGNTR